MDVNYQPPYIPFKTFTTQTFLFLINNLFVSRPIKEETMKLTLL